MVGKVDGVVVQIEWQGNDLIIDPKNIEYIESSDHTNQNNHQSFLSCRDS